MSKIVLIATTPDSRMLDALRALGEIQVVDESEFFACQGRLRVERDTVSPDRAK